MQSNLEFGKRHIHLVPFPVIQEAIQKFIDGTLSNLRYEPEEGKIVTV